LSGFTEHGYLFTRKGAAITGDELVAGELALWFDATAGAAALRIKAKQADGTVRTGVVNLT